MKKYLFFLLTIWIPMTVWAQTPTHTTSTHTLTIEVGTKNVLLEVYCANNNNCKHTETVVRKDTTYIVEYQLEEGETYKIYINRDGSPYEFGNVYSEFTAWMRDGAVYSTSPELRLTMGKSDIYLTAVMTRKAARPYSPGANWFDASTGVLTLDEIRGGSISGAYTIAKTRYNFERDDVLSMVFVGRLKSDVSLQDFYDFKVNLENSSYFNNLLLIDLSQTSGMTTLKSFQAMADFLPKLEHIILGPSLEKIENYAFSLFNINTIDCYAETPPTCAPNAFGYMKVAPNKMLVRVPPQSVELYQQAPGWNDFYNIQPLYETSNITVTLPSDAPKGYYEDMTVELTNLRSQFVQNRKVLNKRDILFGGQVRGGEYQAILKNAYGQVMGQTSSVELGEDDIKLTIDNLLRSKDISLKVTTPDGKDVTGKVQVLWTDESDKAMGYASNLKAIAEGTKLTCKIVLMNELAKQYVMPDAQQYTVNGEGENLLTVQLLPIQQLMLHGQVKDKQTGENIADATVALTQQHGDDHQSVTATTDADGRYELQGTNESGELSVTAAGYLPQTIAIRTPASDGTLPSVEMEPFNGVTVNTWLTYTEAVPEGTESIITDGYKDEGDVVWQLYNQTKNAEVKNFIIKENMLFFPSEVAIGDELTVTASSHNNTFSPVSATCEISNSGTGFVTLPLVQNGALKATVNTTDSTSEMGVLYDADGRFVRSNSYRYGALSFTGLTAGDYSLISMTSNTLLRRVLLLSTLDDMGLAEGTDYVKTPVHIEDGKIVSVHVPNVPVLDMQKLHFTDSKTYFVTNKNIINADHSFIIRSQLSFAEQYAGRIGNVELVVDMPEGIDLAENSALTGSTPCNYRIEEGHYFFPVENMADGNIRLCLKPKKAGEFYVTGSVRFTLDGVQIVQPVGTVWVQTVGFTINTPVFITPSILQVRGSAPLACRGKNVEVYDNDKLVGNPTIDAEGLWFLNILIPAKGTPHLHAVKARMTTLETGVIESPVKYITSNDNSRTAGRVVMLPHYIGENTFNYVDNTVTPTLYTYFMRSHLSEKYQLNYTAKFTFLAYFVDLDISQVESVKISVLASDGTIRTLDAKYDATKQCYYASSDYPHSSKLPISAYAYAERKYSPLSEEEKAALKEEMAKTIKNTTQVAVNAANKKGEIEVLPDDGETLNLKYTVNGKDPMAFTMKEMNYDEAVTYSLEHGPVVLRNNEGNIVYTFVNGTDEAEMILIDVENHTALRTVISDAEIDDLGAISSRRFPSESIPTPEAVYAFGFGAGSKLLSLLGLLEYAKAPAQAMGMQHQAQLWNNIIQKRDNAVRTLMHSLCPYSEKPRFTEKEYEDYFDRIEDLEKRGDDLFKKLDNYQDAYMEDLARKIAFDICSAVLGGALGKAAALEAANKLGPKAWPTINKVEDYLASETGEMLTAEFGFIKDLVNSGKLGNTSLDQLLSLDYDRHYKDFEDRLEKDRKSILNDFENLRQDMIDNQHCNDEECEGDDCDDNDDDDDDDNDDDDDLEPDDDRHKDFSAQVYPLIDPSGYVYEAVPSNRIEGATATIYYKDFMLNQNGNSTGENDVLWDAENYDQINPQITDATGMFQWDVPQGLWQVRVQKEGYENNTSDWLPVPPPQLDVNIPLVRNRLPKVEKAHAYEDAVAVKFDTYMIPALLTTDLITVTQNGNAVEGTIELTDEEEAPDGAAYASRLRFIPSTPFTANEVTLFISGLVQNYSGIEMDEPFEAVLPIEREVKNLVADKKTKVTYGGIGLIHVKAEPAAAAAGKTVLVQCASGIIASAIQTAVVLDEKGEADVTIQGDLPGNEIITFTMQEPELTASTLVKVVMTSGDFQVDAPEASIPSETEVEKGTEITLSCKTEGAAIYYTLDGTSPVDSGTRILYDGTPVVINAETTITVVAIVEGKGMSEVRIYHYTVANNQKIEEAKSQEPKANSQKLLRNGQLLILRDGKTFTVLGTEIK